MRLLPVSLFMVSTMLAWSQPAVVLATTQEGQPPAPSVQAAVPVEFESQVGESIEADAGVNVPPPQVVPGRPQEHQHADDSYSRPRRGLMIAGWTVFGSTYILSALVGTAVYDSALYEDQPDFDPEAAQELELHIPRSRRHAYGRAMYVPIVGPFIAASKTSSASMGLATSLLGTAQLTGLALGIVGTIRYANSMQRSRYQFSYLPSGDGGVATLSGRF